MLQGFLPRLQLCRSSCSTCLSRTSRIPVPLPRVRYCIFVGRRGRLGEEADVPRGRTLTLFPSATEGRHGRPRRPRRVRRRQHCLLPLLADARPADAPVNTTDNPILGARRPSFRRSARTTSVGSILTLTIWGSSFILLVGLFATLIAMALGAVDRVVAGYYGQLTETRADAVHGLVPRDTVPSARDRPRIDCSEHPRRS